MKKSTLVNFGVFALIFAVGIPFLAMRGEGGGAEDVQVAEADAASRDLFQTNCGSCHALAAAGTDGVIGPDLDRLLGAGAPEANRPRVLSAIENGVGGRMPAGILTGRQAEEVADFVARTAGR